MKDDTFYLTAYHVLLLRCASVRWCDDELGASGLDPKYPYGDSDLDGSMARAIGLDPNDLSPRIAAGLNRLHRETERALQVILASRSFELGSYKQLQPYNNLSWARVGPLPEGYDGLPELRHAVVLSPKGA